MLKQIETASTRRHLAGDLAVGVLGSAVAALPANVFSIWMNFSGSVLASIWSRGLPVGIKGGSREAAVSGRELKRARRPDSDRRKTLLK